MFRPAPRHGFLVLIKKTRRLWERDWKLSSPHCKGYRRFESSLHFVLWFTAIHNYLSCVYTIESCVVLWFVALLRFFTLLCYVAWCFVIPLRSADLHYFKSLIFFSCKSSLLFLEQGTVIVLFFYCVMWPLKRNLVQLKNAGRCSPLCCYVALMFCCYVPIRYLCYVMCLAVLRCVALFGWEAFDCFALWCVLLWWAVRCFIMVIASCTVMYLRMENVVCCH